VSGAKRCLQGRFSRAQARRAKMTDAEAYGKTVWSWHPWLVSSCRWRIRSDRIEEPSSRQRWRQDEFVQGERGISRQTIRQGMPACSGCTCMLVCVSLCAVCTRDRGCSKHPAFPAPSRLRDKEFQQSSGAVGVARTQTHIPLSSSAKADDPVCQRRQ